MCVDTFIGNGNLSVHGEGKTNEGMHSDGGWRIVTTARSVFDVLAGRSCLALHVHRTRPNPCSL